MLVGWSGISGVVRRWVRIVSDPIFRSFFKNLFVLLALYVAAVLSRRGMTVIVLTERLGDLVAAQAILERDAAARGRIYWAVKRPYKDVVRFNPRLSGVIPVSGYLETLFLRRVFRKIRWLDLHVDGWQCSEYHTIAQNESAIGMNATNYYDYGSLSDVYSLIACGTKAEGFPAVHAPPGFNARGFLAQHLQAPENPALVVHFTSEEACRSWPAGKAKEFAEWLLVSTDLNIIEFGLKPVLQESQRVCLPRKTITLGQQMALVARGDLFLGVDSGFAHLANAFAVPSIYLIGRYRGFSGHLPWRLREHNLVVRSAGDSPDITVADVQQVVQDMIGWLGLRT